jgi:hypothetical protein
LQSLPFLETVKVKEVVDSPRKELNEKAKLLLRNHLFFSFNFIRKSFIGKESLFAGERNKNHGKERKCTHDDDLNK